MEDEAPKKKRRRRRSFPIKIKYDGKIYRGYSYEIQNEWLILDTVGFDTDAGRVDRTWFNLGKVATFSIDERGAVNVQPRAIQPGRPLVLHDITPLINVPTGESNEGFSKSRNRQLEALMGPDLS